MNIIEVYFSSLLSQFKKGLEAAKGLKISGQFQRVIVCGMGASNWPAWILKTWLKAEKVPVAPHFYLWADYQLPFWVDKQTLVIISSFSGNTEETISCLNEAIKRRLPVVLLTTNGQIKKIGEEKFLPLVVFPSDMPAARLAWGYNFGSLLGIFYQTGLIKKDILDKFIFQINQISPFSFKNQGRRLAEELKDRIPLFYTSQTNKVLGFVWRTKINENVKIPAFNNYFPDLNHYELSMYTLTLSKQRDLLDKFYIIIFQDKNEHPQILKRIKLTTELLKRKNIPFKTIELKGKNYLLRLLNCLILSDWVSYYLAQSYGIDFLKTELQEEFKKKCLNAGMAELADA